jgi:hypothetical protein
MLFLVLQVRVVALLQWRLGGGRMLGGCVGRWCSGDAKQELLQ